MSNNKDTLKVSLNLIESVVESTIEIGSDVLMHSLLERSHYSLDDYSPDSIDLYRQRVLDYLEQHQRELDIAVRSLEHAYSDSVRAERSLKSDIDSNNSIHVVA